MTILIVKFGDIKTTISIVGRYLSYTSKSTTTNELLGRFNLYKTCKNFISNSIMVGIYLLCMTITTAAVKMI